MSDKHADDWGNYWQGRAATEAGAALVGVGVETDEDINAFWSTQLGVLPKTAKLLDLACGAGTVIRQGLELGLKNVTGVDISGDAIKTLKAAYPEAEGVVASADATGLPDASFDVVVSQFGFEYADPIKAAIEASRLLASGGRFTALAHAQNSAIEAEVVQHGTNARDILESGFIDTARSLFIVVMKNGDDAAFAKASQEFSAPQQIVLELAKRTSGLAAHLYEGTQTLYTRRRAYALEDITGWLSGMEAEIKAYVGRMDSMRKAALSANQAEAVLSALQGQGLKPAPLKPFVSARGDTIGWALSAQKD